jgi:hypothetical protein
VVWLFTVPSATPLVPREVCCLQSMSPVSSGSSFVGHCDRGGLEITDMAWVGRLDDCYHRTDKWPTGDKPSNSDWEI